MTGLEPLDARPDNLSEVTFETIRNGIVSRQLPPGSRVSEQKIAAQLQVSKTPVREALLRLRHAGLVEPVGRGLCVVMPSDRAIRDAYEVRAGLEHTSARLAATRATPEQAESLILIAAKSLAAARSGDGGEFRGSDRDFHLAVANAAGNSLLSVAIKESLILTSVLRERDVPPAGDSVDCAEEHVKVAEAIRAGLVESASERMADHVRHVATIVLTARAASEPISS
ncbi:MAG: GntR family transcriptional regulator [Pseudonocardiaceae bacterium]